MSAGLRASGFGLRVGVALVSVGCGHAAIESCDDDLGGVYDDGSNARWMILDNGASLEAYPLFDDFAQGSDLEQAPRALDLHRPKLAGDVRRRFTHYPGGVACTSRASVRVTDCSDDRLELVVGDPSAPTSYAPCVTPPVATRVEHWRRVR